MQNLAISIQARWSQIKGFFINGDRRLRLVKALTESRERIVKEAANQLFQRRPSLVSPGGNAYGEEMTATCLRDMDYLALDYLQCRGRRNNTP